MEGLVTVLVFIFFSLLYVAKYSNPESDIEVGDFSDYPRYMPGSKNIYNLFDLGILNTENCLKPEEYMTKSEFASLYNQVFKSEINLKLKLDNEETYITADEAFKLIIDGLGYKVEEGTYIYGSKEEDYRMLRSALGLDLWINESDDEFANRETIFMMIGNSLKVTFKNFDKDGYTSLYDMYKNEEQFDFSIYDPERLIEFNNEVLDEYIRTKYELFGEIYWKDLLSIKSIKLEDYDDVIIDDLSDLVWFINLEEFVIKEMKDSCSSDGEEHWIKIPKLSHLKRLKRFEYDLCLCNFYIEEFSCMKSLKVLNLGNNMAYGHISAIKDMKDLEYFKVSGKLYGSISIFAELKNLKVINTPEGSSLCGNIKAFSELYNLEELYLCECYIDGDLEALNNLTKLKVLSLLDNHLEIVGDIQSLQDMISIEELCLSDASIYGDINAIKPLNKLKKLFVENTQISGQLEEFNVSNLVSLNLAGTQIKGNIKSLKHSDELKEVILNNTRISGILSELEALKSLEVLEVDNTITHGSITLSNGEIVKRL